MLPDPETLALEYRLPIMGYHPRIECAKRASFLTTRSRNAELWFVNNSMLEEAILGAAARLTHRYNVALYALAIEGNHIHGPAHFPGANRAHFMRDLNSFIAKAVPRYVPTYRGGRFWGKRYSSEFLPGNEDIEEYFFYTVLQPINDGLVEKISDYPGYNCFNDAVNGIERKFKYIRWAEYNEARRTIKHAAIKDYTEIVVLKYARLPGYDHLTQREYAKLMHQKLEARRIEIIKRRQTRGLGFMGTDRLLAIRPGTRPRNSKTATEKSHRPRVLSVCPKRRHECRTWYFKIYFEYKCASEAYRSGNLRVKFPPGTYRPSVWHSSPNPEISTESVFVSK